MLNQVILVGDLISGPTPLTAPHQGLTHTIVIQVGDDTFPVHVWSGIVDEIRQHRNSLIGVKGRIIICDNGVGLGIAAERISFITAETE